MADDLKAQATIEGCCADFRRWTELKAEERARLVEHIVQLAPGLGSDDVASLCHALMMVPTAGMGDGDAAAANQERPDAALPGSGGAGANAAGLPTQAQSVSPGTQESPLKTLFVVIELCACLHQNCDISGETSASNHRFLRGSNEPIAASSLAQLDPVDEVTNDDTHGRPEEPVHAGESVASPPSTWFHNVPGGSWWSDRDVGDAPASPQIRADARNASECSMTYPPDTDTVSPFAGVSAPCDRSGSIHAASAARSDSAPVGAATANLRNLTAQCMLRMVRHAAEVLRDFALAVKEAAARSAGRQAHRVDADSLSKLMQLLHRPSRHLSLGAHLVSGDQTNEEDLRPPWQALLAAAAPSLPDGTTTGIAWAFGDDTVRQLGNSLHTVLTTAPHGRAGDVHDFSAKSLGNLLTVARVETVSVSTAYRMQLLSACTLHMCLLYIYTKCGALRPADEAPAGHGASEGASSRPDTLPSTGAVVDILVSVRNMCIKSKTLQKLPVELERYLQAYSRLSVGLGVEEQRVAAIERVFWPAASDHNVFHRRKEFCLGRDFRLKSQGVNGSRGKPLVNSGTGVLVVLVPLYGHQPATESSHSASSGSEATGAVESQALTGRRSDTSTAPAQMLVAKVFPICDQTLSAEGVDVAKNLHGAHTEAYFHLYKLAKDRGVALDAVREALLASAPIPEAPAQQPVPVSDSVPGRLPQGAHAFGTPQDAATSCGQASTTGHEGPERDGGASGQVEGSVGLARRRDGPPCHVPALRGVDVSPEPEVSADATNLRKRLLEGGHISDDDVERFSKTIRTVWVLTEHLPDGTLADVLDAVRHLEEAAGLSAPCTGMFKSDRMTPSVLANPFQIDITVLGGATSAIDSMCKAAPMSADAELPKDRFVRAADALKRELASHVVGARTHVSAMIDPGMYLGRAREQAAGDHMKHLVRALESLISHGWPATVGMAPSDEASLRHQNAFVFWLSWRTKLRIMRDIIRGVAQAHAGKLNVLEDASANESEAAFCHADISPGNVMLRDWKAYIIDWANACMPNPATGLCQHDNSKANGKQQPASTRRTCQRGLHSLRLSGAPELVFDQKSDGVRAGTRFLANRTSSLPPELSSVGNPSLRESDTMTSHSSVNLADGSPLQPNSGPHPTGPQRSLSSRGERSGADPPLPNGKAQGNSFDKHARSDVWMCGILFCQIIRLTRLEAEDHCRTKNYSRLDWPDQPIGDGKFRLEPMSALLPREGDWWLLMPPVFSNSEVLQDSFASWADLWKRLRGLILNRMLVHVEERACAADVLAAMDGLCEELDRSGGPLSHLL
eukprot:jgi/Ulvmu1/12426/UM009_0076.1